MFLLLKKKFGNLIKHLKFYGNKYERYEIKNRQENRRQEKR